MENKTFYRVCNIATQQGLWYNTDGDFTGLIHNKFSFCQNKELKMDYDPEICGYVSVVETLEALYHWFSQEDIVKLQAHSWYIHQYTSSDYKWYDRFKHYVMNQANSNLIESFRILDLGKKEYKFDQV